MRREHNNLHNHDWPKKVLISALKVCRNVKIWLCRHQVSSSPVDLGGLGARTPTLRSLARVARPHRCHSDNTSAPPLSWTVKDGRENGRRLAVDGQSTPRLRMGGRGLIASRDVRWDFRAEDRWLKFDVPQLTYCKLQVELRRGRTIKRL